MEKYLRKLVKEHNRVIIPNFGAFIVSQGKEDVSVIFNSFLSFNDGLLISYISNEEGIDTGASAQKIDDFVSRINQSLQTGGVFEIDELGRFTKDNSGTTRFIQYGTKNDTQNKPGEREETSLQNSDLLDIGTADDDAIIVNEPFITSEQNEPENLLTIETPAIEKTIEHQNKNISTQNTMETANDTPNSNQLYSDDTADEKKRIFSIRLTVIILVGLLLLALAGFLLFSTSPLNPFTHPTPVETEQPVDEVPQIQESEPEPEPIFTEPEPVAEPVATGPQHYIILGSFRDDWRASQLVEKLHTQGYTQASIIERNSRFLVSVESYPTVSKALNRQEALTGELQMESWVLSVR